MPDSTSPPVPGSDGRRQVGGLDVAGVCLGGDVFGWTLDRDGAFAVLDAYVEAGGDFLDTADVYCQWVPGNSGGESETIIGAWMAARGNRDQLVLASKMAKLTGSRGLSAANIRACADASLARLGTDRIDLYYAHEDDPAVPQEETAAAFDGLVRAGKVRALGASNFPPDRLRSALATSAREGLAAYAAVQDYYNLVGREPFESGIGAVAAEHGLAVLPYGTLAGGFLSGKYRPGVRVDSVRAEGATRLLGTARGQAVLAALDEVAAGRQVPVAAVAVAWLRAQPGVAAPISSPRTLPQVRDLVAGAQLDLTAAELTRLTTAST